MKKWIFLVCLTGAGLCSFAQDSSQKVAESAAAPAKTAAEKEPQTESASLTAPVFQTEKEAKKAFKQRRKKINKLVKAYRKASAEEKPVIKQELLEVVSQGMDLGLANAKARISQQRANLERWESKLAQSEQNWDELKAQRVEELLSGEAERKFKLAQKNWKKQMKDQKRRMR